MIDDLIKERLKKLEQFKKSGHDPYPPRVKQTHSIGMALKDFSSLQKGHKKISVVGRVVGLRIQGSLLFADLKDITGSIQLVIKKDNLKDFQVFKDALDIGDFLEAGGMVFKTQRGEKSIEVKSLNLIVKSLRPLPSNWHGLTDIETRLRKRYLDLIANPDLRRIFEVKTKFWETFRTFLKNEGFLEVETPILETVPGGADAEPFVTHHNTLNVNFYLRISLEIALKKLMVGGFEKVFEIGRIFRNEGIDAEHLQDYTQMEFYWAYHDYNDLMKLVEKLYKEVIKKSIGSLTTVWHGQKINWAKKWPKISYYEIFKKQVSLDLKIATTEDLHAKAVVAGLKPENNLSRGRLIDLLFKKFCRPTFTQPAFLIDPPVDIEPLAKRVPGDTQKVERFQVVACQTELGKGFSEANDPIDQRQRFEEQMEMRDAGDKEAQQLDEDFLEALEYGMPPTAGFGVSERLFAILMDKPVREVVFFPLMRPKQ